MPPPGSKWLELKFLIAAAIAWLAIMGLLASWNPHLGLDLSFGFDATFTQRAVVLTIEATVAVLAAALCLLNALRLAQQRRRRVWFPYARAITLAGAAMILIILGFWSDLAQPTLYWNPGGHQHAEAYLTHWLLCVTFLDYPATPDADRVRESLPTGLSWSDDPLVERDSFLKTAGFGVVDEMLPEFFVDRSSLTFGTFNLHARLLLLPLWPLIATLLILSALRLPPSRPRPLPRLRLRSPRPRPPPTLPRMRPHPHPHQPLTAHQPRPRTASRSPYPPPPQLNQFHQYPN